MALKIPASPSGMFAVTIARVFPHTGFNYKPSQAAIVVDRALLDDMLAETGLVLSVAAA